MRSILFPFCLLLTLAATAQTPAAAAAAQNPVKAGNDTSTVSLKTATGTLYGSLVMPAGHQTLPVVLIIAGSGPTDRDGNSRPMLHSDMYKGLADSLAQHGIASLRYDKRGVAASAAALRSEADITFEDYIADAVGFIGLLRADRRFTRVIVFGHSEGSLVGMVAAQQAKVDAYISASGAGDRIDKVIYPQIAAQSRVLADSAQVLFDSLSKGYHVQEPHNGLRALFRASVQRYMISWLHYDPQVEIKKLHIPVLIIQGATDLQTTVADAEKLKAALPAATLKVIPGMNHIFREAGTGRQQNISTYSMPSLPLVSEAVTDITAFVLTVH
jgi:pimeloyl-ACP methyl ester carboxylesterase